MTTFIIQQHKKQVEQKHRHAKEIRKQATRVANSNDQYDDKLQEQNIALFERKHISQDMSKTLRTCLLRNIECFNLF